MKKNLLFIVALIVSGIANAQTWTMQASAFTNVASYPFGISITDANTAWCVAYDGGGTNFGRQEFSRTLDAGTTWASGTVVADTNLRFCGISAVDAVTAYAMMYNNTVGTGGGVYKTTDGGATWNQSGVGSIFNATSFPDVIYFWDALNGFALGDPNPTEFEIYTTSDGGATWTPAAAANIPNPVSGEYGIVNDYTVVGNTVWFGTNKGRVFKSIDRGVNWTVAAVPASGAKTISTIAFSDANIGLCTSAPATGTAYTMYKTTDGGTTWVLTASTGTRYLSDLAAIPGTSIFVSAGAGANTGGGASAGKTRGSSYSLDGGASWVLIDSSAAGTTDGYTELAFLDLTTGWAGGFTVDAITDGIYKWNPGSVNINDVTPKAEMVAYPNPSTGIVNLDLKVKNSQVHLLVVDAMGRVVFENTYQSAGSIFKKSFDFSGYAKGIYNVLIDTNNERLNERLIIE